MAMSLIPSWAAIWATVSPSANDLTRRNWISVRLSLSASSLGGDRTWYSMADSRRGVPHSARGQWIGLCSGESVMGDFSIPIGGLVSI